MKFWEFSEKFFSFQKSKNGKFFSFQKIGGKPMKTLQNHCYLSLKFFKKFRKSFEIFRVPVGIVSIFMRNIYPWKIVFFHHLLTKYTCKIITESLIFSQLIQKMIVWQWNFALIFYVIYAITKTAKFWKRIICYMWLNRLFVWQILLMEPMKLTV